MTVRSVVRHPLFYALIVSALLSFYPVVDRFVKTGVGFEGVPQTYTDEFIYYAQVREIATGNLFFGNPYFIEHRYSPTLALFGSSIFAAIPLFLGASLELAHQTNFIIWGALFIILVYALFRELGMPRWVGAAGGLFVYLQSYDLVFRLSVQQQVFPFFFLFYVALIRFLKQPENLGRRAILAVATGVSFYVYGFLWQLVVVSLGFTGLYAIGKKNWKLVRATLLTSIAGGLIGAPAFAYTLWVMHQPFFWESMNRWGLVASHLPMGEVITSGFVVPLGIGTLWVLYACSNKLRSDAHFLLATLFFTITGLALWVTQGSNLLSGKLLENGEHLKRFIIPWSGLVGVFCVMSVYSIRRELSRARFVVVAVLGVLAVLASVRFLLIDVSYFFPDATRVEFWKKEQTYQRPLAWLDAKEEEPVVVWANPHTELPTYVTALTRHYVLFQNFGQFNLLSNDEFHERYLVSQYFDAPTTTRLMEDMPVYAGRSHSFHHPKTIERGIKLCRLLHVFANTDTCGTPPTPQELIGDEFFINLETKFKKEIRPHLTEYLEKYHVSYIIKDLEEDAHYQPESVGGIEVYNDGYVAIYQLASTTHE